MDLIYATFDASLGDVRERIDLSEKPGKPNPLKWIEKIARPALFDDWGVVAIKPKNEDAARSAIKEKLTFLHVLPKLSEERLASADRAALPEVLRNNPGHNATMADVLVLVRETFPDFETFD
jgi:hypothetical protein